jgi:L-amino acid N-acyltransferase YncA
VLIRHADPERDARACAAIYAPSVADGVASFEAVPPGPGEFARRIAAISERYPWLVAEIDGVVTGFAYASAHRERAAYRWSAECTVYIAEGHRGQGVGKRLYTDLFELLARQNLRTVCAGITLPNDASVALHESCGFALVGVYRRIGYKLGDWHDVGWWQLDLPSSDEDPPPEPGPPVRLAP